MNEQRWADLEGLARGLEAEPALAAEGAVFRARGHLARREFAEARRLLGGLIEARPRWPVPRRYLSYALLQEGEDPDAAERALRDLLELEPDDAEARHNLRVLSHNRAAARDAAFEGPVALAQLYEAACRTPSDIHEHLPTLYQLAKECRHVTELGTRSGVSTTALLFAQPDVLVCYDTFRYPEVDHLARLAGRTEFVFHQQDVLYADLEETDLLFIDTWHVYEQLQKELALHGPKARRYIVLHDTTTFGEAGEEPGHRGLWPAVEEFLARGEFRLKLRLENNNGLAVLERQGGAPPPRRDVFEPVTP